MSSPRTCAEQPEISDLPPEVFPIIFKHLSVNERKAVKLVCKSWLEFCNIPSLLSDEVLTHYKIHDNTYQLSDVYELLQKSERQFLKLKFVKVNFYDAASFWKNNGLKIRSIDFEDCQFSDGVLAEIIICCEKLFHLGLSFTEVPTRPYPLFLQVHPIIDVEEVLAKGIVRENLSSIEIYFYYLRRLRFSDHILHQLFLIFPCVKILKITSHFISLTEDISVDLTELPCKYDLTMSPVLNYLIASVNRIEKLKLFFHDDSFSQNSLRCILETVSSLHRLTELSIRVNGSDDARTEDLRTFLFPKQLKSLDFYIGMDSSDLTPFLLQLLHSNSNLQYLKIDYPEVIVTKPFYEKLMSSGLKSFVVTAESVYMEDLDSFGSDPSTQNECVGLPSLSVTVEDGTSRPSRETRSFLQYYQSLHHLKIERISPDNLQFLLKHQTKLRSLTIESSSVNDSIDISPDHLTFNELTDIEYLNLRCHYVGDYFLRTLSPEPILAKLKYLLVFVSKLDPSDLLRLANAMPFLEGLCILKIFIGIRISFDVIVELCIKLNRLRYLNFSGDWLIKDGDLADEHYRKLFSICPSLRVVKHYDSLTKARHIYFFDTTKQEVILKRTKRPYHLDGFGVNELGVDWLEF